MKEQLLEYGFKPYKYDGWLEYERNGWTFNYCVDGYMWIYPPKCGEGEGIALHKLTYEKIIRLIDFISEYE